MSVKFSLTGGQEAECKQAIPLLENGNASAVLADNAYDTSEKKKLSVIILEKSVEHSKIPFALIS
jgi:transposase